VLHARTALTIRVQDNGGTIRVEVVDGSRTPPVRRTFADVSPTGRGLHLLDRLASRWGSAPTGTGKTVWFEIDVKELT
jgi:hypothetical protein